MKRLFLLIFSLISLLFVSCGSNSIKNVCAKDEDNKFICTFGGDTRNFILYLPETQDFSNTNLILLFHGYGSSAVFFRNTVHMEREALERNYAVVYLSGIPKKAVKASSSGWDYSYTKSGKKEIAFVSELIRYLKKEYGIGGKTFGVGFSNGAFFLNKVASEYSDIFSAVASVGGMMSDTVWSHRPEYTETRFIQINGSKDDVVPSYENEATRNNPNPPMEEVISFFAKDKNQNYDAEIIDYSVNTKILKYGNKAWWVIIDKYTHAWPTERYCGYNINNLIVDFFDFSL